MVVFSPLLDSTRKPDPPVNKPNPNKENTTRLSHGNRSAPIDAHREGLEPLSEELITRLYVGYTTTHNNTRVRMHIVTIFERIKKNELMDKA